MRYCSRCLYPANHPLGITFDEQGVCSGCRIHEEKDALDWGERREKLRRILEEFRCRSGKTNDCILPVSGARDSHFIAHVIKHEFGMRPLLVGYNKHYNTPRGIRNLAYLRTLVGCDFIGMHAAPETVRRVTRLTIKHLASMYWHCLAGETVFPVKMAVKLKIPLIVWGAHQGLDQTGMFSHLDEVEMTRKYRKEHDLMGLEAENLAGLDGTMTLRDLAPWIYPSDEEIESVGVRGIYLGNYIRWDSKAQHEAMIDRYGYETAEEQRTFDTYNDVDSFHYSGLHDWLKFVKWGYGKASDHASREIRLRRMTREEGIALVRRYETVYPADIPLFAEWLGVEEKTILDAADNFRDSRIWRRDDDGSWRLLDSVTRHEGDVGVENARLKRRELTCTFKISKSRDPGDSGDKYVFLGRGHVDAVPPPMGV